MKTRGSDRDTQLGGMKGERKEEKRGAGGSEGDDIMKSREWKHLMRCLSEDLGRILRTLVKAMAASSEVSAERQAEGHTHANSHAHNPMLQTLHNTQSTACTRTATHRA